MREVADGAPYKVYVQIFKNVDSKLRAQDFMFWYLQLSSTIMLANFKFFLK